MKEPPGAAIISEDRDLLLRWVAGFFDGEGSVVVSCSGGHIYVRTSLFQRKLVPLLRLVALFGGVIRFREPPENRPLKGSRGGYVWELNGADAGDFCRAILPYSMVKAEELAVAVQFTSLPWRYRRSSGKFHRKSDGEKAEELRIVAKMKEIKHELRTEGR